MTNKQHVKMVCPSAYSFKREYNGKFEVWTDKQSWIEFAHPFKQNIYYLGEGDTIQLAWKNAWIKVQQMMIWKLEV